MSARASETIAARRGFGSRGFGRVLAVVLGAHFLSALGALGLPPLFALLLPRAFPGESIAWAGLLAVLPAALAAVSAPLWGRCADRWGQRALLLRAQLGLAFSFWLASLARTPLEFALALGLQGLLGGTFSASRAYLAAQFERSSNAADGGRAGIAHALTWLEASPRLALLVGPIAAAMLFEWTPSLAIYRYFAVLPLLSAALAFGLPSGSTARSTPPHTRSPEAPGSRWLPLHAAQLALTAGGTMIAPFFMVSAQDGTGVSPFVASLLFGLPHLTYLGVAPALTWLSSRGGLPMIPARPLLIVGLSGLALSAGFQGHATSLPSLGVARLAQGLSLTAALMGFHGWIAATLESGRAGRAFGWLETCSRVSALLGGAIASWIVSRSGASAVFDWAFAWFAFWAVAIGALPLFQGLVSRWYPIRSLSHGRISY